MVLTACTARDPEVRIAPSPSTATVRAPAKPTDPIEVAITVDDLPRHGPDLPGRSRVDLHQKLLEAFAKYRTPPVHGFINASGLEGHAEDEKALVQWLAAGHRLGNHTYSHIDGAKASLADYLADVDKNEAALLRLAGGQPAQTRAWKVFRYPYLREGKDLDSHTAIRKGLVERGYRLAGVTIDFYDWAYNQAYVRCLEQKRDDAVPGLKESFLDQASAELVWADGAARELAGRPIKHILLLHVGHFTGEMMDELLTM
jgi:peptidoglycan-N-acetylglucosamine deacetylase